MIIVIFSSSTTVSIIVNNIILIILSFIFIYKETSSKSLEQMSRLILQKSSDPNVGLARLAETAKDLLVAQESVAISAAKAASYKNDNNGEISKEDLNKVCVAATRIIAKQFEYSWKNYKFLALLCFSF